MSAYICNENVFATLGAFAALTVENDAQKVADVLKAENIRSVNFRYSDDTETTPADLSAAIPAPNKKQLLDMLSEYDYQACKCDDYNETEAAKLVNRIRSAAVAFVPNDNSRAEYQSLIGSPLYEERTGRRGYVVAQGVAVGKTYTLSVGGFKEDDKRVLKVVWLTDSGLQCNEQNANHLVKFLMSRYNWPSISPAQADVLLSDFEKEQAERQRIYKEKIEKQHQEQDAFRAELSAIMPEDCKGVIIAELKQDDSDRMSDYFASSTQRVLILGFSKHNRDLFPEMRKAAKAADLEDLPQVLELADPKIGEEHREKWSIGKGYYIAEKGTSTYSGWQLSKISACKGELLSVDRVPVGEIRIKQDEPSKPEKEKKTENSAIFVNLNEEKSGVEIQFKEKPAADIRAKLKEMGFRWSRRLGLWYAKQSEKTVSFAQSLAGAA